MCSLTVFYCFGLLLVPLLVYGGDADLRHNGGAPHQQRIVIGVDGGTESIRACCFDARTGVIVGNPCAVAYPTHHPHPGWAEQDPESWWKSLGQAVRTAVASLQGSKSNENCEICGIALDTTCCSVVALDDNFRPLRPCLLWMDQRSAPQTRTILELAHGDPALLINGNGQGPVSAEWMTSKALWIRDNEPEIWKEATHIGEYQDYLNYKLTGHWVASSCNAASRWHWNGEECLVQTQPLDTNPFPGRPMSFYQKLGIPELAEKLPSRCLAMGERVGYLTPEAAAHLGLPEELPVIQGGPDAFVGMIGLGCIHPGQLCLITGSSHLHCVVTSHPTTAPGTWGAYRGAPLPGLHFAEGGQAATGSTLRWAKDRLFSGDNNQQNDETLSYQILDEQAAAVPPGSNGLVALETFQGSRTPVTDPLARGALIGLALSHTRAHLWRAMLEAVCFGTRACIDGLEAAGHPCDEIILAGGVTRSDMWLQMHADVTGKTVLVCENSDAPLLGSAILASVGVGIHKTVEDAVNDMVRVSRRIYPNKDVAVQYDRLYNDIYSRVFEAVKPISHKIHQLRGGGQPNQFTISPSLLACDWANIREEVHRCMKAGLNRFHVDIFDGVFLDSPNALTFGPQMVEAIRRSCDSFMPQHKASLDLHVCVDRPSRFVDVMAAVGGDCFIFQWEAMEGLDSAVQLAEKVVKAGMKCGISINPCTSVDDIFPLLERGLIDVVDILAVEPGFGGQRFQTIALSKIRSLKVWRELNSSLPFDIMVDGGINEETVADVFRAGADIMVAGTYLFRHPTGIETGASTLTQTTTV